MKEPAVLVLLSTFNGEKYIEEQLKSVLSQKGVKVVLVIRDDGSRDSTIDILKRYHNTHNESVYLYVGENLGARGSFFELMKYALSIESNYDFFSFCDQDDVWGQNKLYQAVNLMNKDGNEEQEVPMMYCSVTQMVDAELTSLTRWPNIPAKSLTLYNALIENMAVGCTIVINRQTLNLISKFPPDDPSKVIMHDWWVYLCVSAFGRVIFDEEPYILYRQHNNNLLGGKTGSIFEKAKIRICRYFKGEYYYIRRYQAREFLSCFYSVMDPQDRQAIEQFLDILNRNWIFRVLYIGRTPFFRQSMIDNLIFKLTYITGKV